MPAINAGIPTKALVTFLCLYPYEANTRLTLVREILISHGYDFSLKTNSDGLTAFTIHFVN